MDEKGILGIVCLVLLFLMGVIMREYSKKDNELNQVRHTYLRDMQKYEDTIKVLKTELLITR